MFYKLINIGLKFSDYPKIYWRVTKLIRFLYSMEIIFSTGLKIGTGTRFIHNGLGCVIHGNTKIGNYCRIYQNVTIGGNSKFKGGEDVNEGIPEIGNGVIIYAGAVIVGPVKIGDYSVIGANTVVTKNVPPHTIVMTPRNFMKINNEEYEYLREEEKQKLKI